MPARRRAFAVDVYATNTELYQDPGLVETVDYARRYRRTGLVDHGLARHVPPPRTTVIAPHGGGIEFGTSELCLAVAGYHPATLDVLRGAGVTHDYWMFEGLRPKDNGALHVTSTGCDDGIATALCGGSRNVLALHGCSSAAAELPDDAQVALVGGRNGALKQQLLAELAVAEVVALDAAGHPDLDGDDPLNITNRTLLGMGGQLEITAPLRRAMFLDNTRVGRATSTTPVFWAVVAACRNALARLEATQPIR